MQGRAISHTFARFGVAISVEKRHAYSARAARTGWHCDRSIDQMESGSFDRRLEDGATRSSCRPYRRELPFWSIQYRSG